MREAELSDASSSCRMIPKVVVAVSYCTFVAMTSVSLSKVARVSESNASGCLKPRNLSMEQLYISTHLHHLQFQIRIGAINAFGCYFIIRLLPVPTAEFIVVSRSSPNMYRYTDSRLPITDSMKMCFTNGVFLEAPRGMLHSAHVCGSVFFCIYSKIQGAVTNIPGV